MQGCPSCPGIRTGLWTGLASSQQAAHSMRVATGGLVVAGACSVGLGSILHPSKDIHAGREA